MLRKHLDRLGWTGGDAAGYACGNPDMIENVKGMLARARFPQGHIHEEKYFTTTGEAIAIEDPAPEPELERPKGPPGGITLKAVRPPGPPGPPGGITLKSVPRK